MIEAPRIETERLLLRQFTLDDYDALAACWASPEMVRGIGGGKPQGGEMSWSRLMRYIGHWKALGYGYWALLEKASGRYIGSVGFQDAHRNISPPLIWPEAGWFLMPAAQGKGYAREAVSAMLRWADDAFDGPVCCIIDEDNRRSVSLAQDCGFTFQHRALYHGKSVRVLIRPPAP